MIPIKGCDPEINVVTIGAKILENLMRENVSIEYIFFSYPLEFEISLDHIILSLDWLFAINAINFDGNEVYINEVTQP
ncbi:ABC-three component system middle component 6 [Desulfobotulus mexicanus]|uniref:ABC-three component system middle component 6 n=1 Tax=Desulfobotulus mexicanus TaxID=2586642 RepID=UPI0015D1D75E|nr:ABC-three component system middle component 6 [Desulfobotulus mexicanus]